MGNLWRWSAFKITVKWPLCCCSFPEHTIVVSSKNGACSCYVCNLCLRNLFEQSQPNVRYALGLSQNAVSYHLRAWRIRMLWLLISFKIRAKWSVLWMKSQTFLLAFSLREKSWFGFDFVHLPTILVKKNLPLLKESHSKLHIEAY